MIKILSLLLVLLLCLGCVSYQNEVQGRLYKIKNTKHPVIMLNKYKSYKFKYKIYDDNEVLVAKKTTWVARGCIAFSQERIEVVYLDEFKKPYEKFTLFYDQKDSLRLNKQASLNKLSKDSLIELSLIDDQELNDLLFE